MIVYENECVGCAPELSCIGAGCPYRRVPHFYCDVCGEECFIVYRNRTGNVVGCDNCITEVNVEDLTDE